MLRTTVFGSQYVGVFVEATDEFLFVRPDLEADFVHVISDEFEAEIVETTVGDAATVGALLVGNSSGLVASSRLNDTEHEMLEAKTGLPVVELPGRINAAGNVILANDTGAFVHRELSEAAAQTIAETLDVTVERGTIAGVPTVGTAATATNKGVLCHPKTADPDLDQLASLLEVPADIGTVNYGGPLVGAGLVANTHGYVAGEETTGPELGRIEDALGFID